MHYFFTFFLLKRIPGNKRSDSRTRIGLETVSQVSVTVPSCDTNKLLFQVDFGENFNGPCFQWETKSKRIWFWQVFFNFISLWSMQNMISFAHLEDGTFTYVHILIWTLFGSLNPLIHAKNTELDFDASTHGCGVRCVCVRARVRMCMVKTACLILRKASNDWEFFTRKH